MLCCLRGLAASAIGVTTLVLGGCTTPKTWTDSGTTMIGTNKPLLTTAELRTVNRSEIKSINDVTHRITPVYITCAEPSPDVAAAVSGGFGLGVSGSGQPGAGAQAATAGATPGELELAASLSASRAEAIAQLGERLATIQLLRDGLYRACEAYANGAITPTTYTLIVSKVDRLMVTLLSTEIAGGAFGRKFSGAGGTANGSATANLAKAASDELKKQIDAVSQAQKQVQTDDKALTDTQAKLADPATPADQKTSLADLSKTQTTTRDNDQAKLDAEQKKLSDIAGDAAVVLATSATSAASASAQAGGEIAGRTSLDAAVAAQIAAIQQYYVDDAAPASAIAACITELSQTINDPTVKRSLLAGKCETLVDAYIPYVHDTMDLKRAAIEVSGLRGSAVTHLSAAFDKCRATFVFDPKADDKTNQANAALQKKCIDDRVAAIQKALDGK